MAMRISSFSSTSSMYRLGYRTLFTAKPTSVSVFPRRTSTPVTTQKRNTKKKLKISLAMEENRGDHVKVGYNRKEIATETENQTTKMTRVEKRKVRKRTERLTYLVAAIMSTFGISSMAVLAVYYRFSWQMEVY